MIIVLSPAHMRLLATSPHVIKFDDVMAGGARELERLKVGGFLYRWLWGLNAYRYELTIFGMKQLRKDQAAANILESE